MIRSMKIAVTTKIDNINSKIPNEFQNANYLLIINTDNEKEYKFIPNMYRRSISGAEIFCSQFLISQEIEIFICGKCNDQARDLLIFAGIKTFEMPNVEIKEVMSNINKIKESSYESSS